MLISALLLLAISHQVAAQNTVTVVTSVDELKDALYSGAAHVEITEHLDLRQLEAHPDSDPGDPKHFLLEASTRSIRGNCVGSPAHPELDPAVPRLQAGQCAILVRYEFIGDASDGNELWLDSLFVRLVRPDRARDGARATRCISVVKKRLWMTNVSLQGDGREGSSGLHAFNTTYIADCSLTNFGGTDALFVDNGATVFAERSTFAENSDAFGSLDTIATIDIWSGYARLESCQFRNNTPGDANVQHPDTGLFVDDADSITLSPGSDPGMLMAIEDIPVGIVWITSDDPAFIQLQGESSDAILPPVTTSKAPVGTPATAQTEVQATEPMTDQTVVQRRVASPPGVSEAAETEAAETETVERPSTKVGSSNDAEDGPGGAFIAKAALVSAVVLLGVAGILFRHSISARFAALRPGVKVVHNSKRDELEAALDSALRARPPLLSQPPPASWLQGRFKKGTPAVAETREYLLVNERAYGGQSVIQFARGAGDGMNQYAIKFFLKDEDYETETRLYADPTISVMLPRLYEKSANFAMTGAEGVAAAPNGTVYPPYLVVERGVTMAEWRRKERSVMHVLGMFHELALHLACLHNAGHVHRDLKPENVLFMMKSQTWRLIDFGIAAHHGDKRPTQCTRAYAAPEIFIAAHHNEFVSVDSAHDIWALGVMVYECITGSSVFSGAKSHAAYHSAALGESMYPWEDPMALHPTFAKVRFREVLGCCLQRDPARRAKASDLARMVERIGNITPLPMHMSESEIAGSSFSAPLLGQLQYGTSSRSGSRVDV